MELENDSQNAFLMELHRLTRGNPEAQQSMYLVGGNLGMDRPASKKTAEDLIGMGLLAIKTLSGAVSLTAEGIAAAQGGAPAQGEELFRLGDRPFLDESARAELKTFLEGLRRQVAGIPKSYAQLEELVIDLKTIDVQLLSPRPRTAVIKALLDSLRQAFAQAGDLGTAGRIERAAR